MQVEALNLRQLSDIFIDERFEIARAYLQGRHGYQAENKNMVEIDLHIAIDLGHGVIDHHSPLMLKQSIYKVFVIKASPMLLHVLIEVVFRRNGLAEMEMHICMHQEINFNLQFLKQSGATKVEPLVKPEQQPVFSGTNRIIGDGKRHDMKGEIFIDLFPVHSMPGAEPLYLLSIIGLPDFFPHDLRLESKHGGAGMHRPLTHCRMDTECAVVKGDAFVLDHVPFGIDNPVGMTREKIINDNAVSCPVLGGYGTDKIEIPAQPAHKNGIIRQRPGNPIIFAEQKIGDGKGFKTGEMVG